MYPFKATAIRVDQPLGSFFIASIPAKLLLDTCHSVRAELLDYEESTSIHAIGKFFDKIKGTQREHKPRRLEQIRSYTEEAEACFPNAIILGANYNTDGEFVSDEGIRWKVEEVSDGVYNLFIPSKEKLASIIDGQHRVFGFEGSSRQEMPLVCSIFIDLPMPYHAQLFTKINTTQKRVDKNLAYNLYQFDMEQGDSETWGPEILAVYFARVLASDKGSPLKGQIKLGLSGSKANTTISMASIVDGILSLITSDSEKDRSLLHKVSLSEGRSRELLREVSTSAPLRELYLNNKDKTLYELISNYLRVLKSLLWDEYDEAFILRRTLGIQATFDFLREIAKHYDSSHYSYDFFENLLKPAQNIDFGDEFFGVQSKVRTRIKNSLYVSSGIKKVEDLQCSEEDKVVIRKLVGEV
ncbi:DGQHR domain-containing protein [Methylophaga pinxianii]|uniref:DGQHR domain-containing protein n=1 Tax=Methylophaga pinxianii TaxID=2881052 RepID=UPI001CF5DDBA|nr:DGQHR domain-containing protein [Methylophaga pinxianii]MCB2426047.1 DGQHR domain-containing protein [Methylophaga pinxianii]UPH46148.1 DGQHR domain-containing protein [Methylophaga pinxianii]